MSDPTERVIVRTTAGLALLLWLALPACVVAWLWSGDWRWLITGGIAFLVGVAIGLLIRGEARHRRVATRPASPGASERASRPTGIGPGLPGDPARAPVPGKGTAA